MRLHVLDSGTVDVVAALDVVAAAVTDDVAAGAGGGVPSHL